MADIDEAKAREALPGEFGPAWNQHILDGYRVEAELSKKTNPSSSLTKFRTSKTRNVTNICSWLTQGKGVNKDIKPIR